MSLKKVGQVREGKPFKIWDLIIYGVIVAVIAALFLAFFLTRDKTPLKGVRIYLENRPVFAYSFDKGEYKVLDADAVQIVGEGERLELKIVSKGGFNDVTIDPKERWAQVTQADCSYRKDCVHTPKIKDNGSTIVCQPHSLKILPYDYLNDDGTLIIG